MDDQLLAGDQVFERLVADLDTAFPHYLPQPHDDISLIMYRAGQRSIVEHLKTLTEN